MHKHRWRLDGTNTTRHSRPPDDPYEGERYRVYGEEEARALLDEIGITNVELFAYDLWGALSLPKEVLESKAWDEAFFRQTVEMVMRLAKEPSVRGTSSHAVVYGEKT